ncbi:hypothetical protein BDZ94DRAFT_858965 [Collybia nuda]|uniref:Uncharacterized protein n=1 Tax=Collybia nuda TaxID=64659 RepID=A0A9P5Y0M1_9AGAR|nr:hypothetical protein BDZ94DRAFT_858965 [Collybia nuda]
MSPNDPFCLPANPEVSGVGIRVAIYTQTLLTFISAFCIHSDSKVTIAELNLIEAQSSIILITALGILISAILKGLTHELSNVHAAVVLNLNWMSSVNVFIYVLLYLRHTIANSGSDDTTWGWRFWWNAIWGPTERVRAVTAEGKYKLIGERGWTKCHNEVLHQGKYLGDSTERKSPAFVLLLSTIHLSLMAIFGFWLWTDPSTFSHSPATCSALPSLAILGHIIPITSSGLRNFSIAIYSLIATPLFNIFIPMALVILFHIWFNRRYQSLIPMNAFLAKAAALIQPQSPSSGMGQNEMFPISVCLVLLVAINAIFVVDTEATLYQNRYLQETGGSGWTFGQILATLLLLIPLCGTVMRLMRCYEWKAQDQFKKVTVAASKLEEGKLEQDKASALPLFQAVYQGQLEYVKYLGENGAYLDLKGVLEFSEYFKSLGKIIFRSGWELSTSSGCNGRASRYCAVFRS